MNTYSQLYWLTRLDGIQWLFIALAIILFITCVVIIVWSFFNADFDEFYTGDVLEKRTKLRVSIVKKLRLLFPVTFLFLIISVLTPTKKDVIFIVAGGKTIDWVKNDTSICNIPSQTTLIISEFLDKQIKEFESIK